MKIGLILHPYEEKKQSGLGRYAWELTKNIIENRNGGNHEYIIFLKKTPKRAPSLKGNNWSVKVINKKYFWLDRGLRNQKLDVCLFFTPVVPFFVKFKKIIIVVHDLGYKYIASEKIKTKFINFIIYWIHKFSIHKADKIAAVSRASKKDILKFFNVPAEKIYVIYNGRNNINSLDEDFVEVPDLFFLFAGVVKPRKNVFNLVKAFKEFKKQDKQNFKLVIAGSYGGDYYEKIFDFIEINKLTSEIIFLGYVSDRQLAYLYKKAYAFVYPSLVEGFGMTILEAMSFGVPALISDIDVFRENFSEASIFFNEKSPADIARSLLDISLNNVLRDELSKKAIKHSARFSWDKTAVGFAKLIND